LKESNLFADRRDVDCDAGGVLSFSNSENHDILCVKAIRGIQGWRGQIAAGGSDNKVAVEEESLFYTRGQANRAQGLFRDAIGFDEGHY
jgi:hypothetical protein